MDDTVYCELCSGVKRLKKMDWEDVYFLWKKIKVYSRMCGLLIHQITKNEIYWGHECLDILYP